MAVTIKELMELKKQGGELRDKIIQANATMKEIDSNIDVLTSELNSLGIKKVEKAQSEIEKMENKAQELYDEAYKKIEKWL